MIVLYLFQYFIILIYQFLKNDKNIIKTNFLNTVF